MWKIVALAWLGSSAYHCTQRLAVVPYGLVRLIYTFLDGGPDVNRGEERPLIPELNFFSKYHGKYQIRINYRKGRHCCLNWK